MMFRCGLVLLLWIVLGSCEHAPDCCAQHAAFGQDAPPPALRKPVFTCTNTDYTLSESLLSPMVFLHSSYLDQPRPYDRPARVGDFYKMPAENLQFAAKRIAEGGVLTDRAGNRPIMAPRGAAIALNIEGHAQVANVPEIIRWITDCRAVNRNRNIGVFYGSLFTDPVTPETFPQNEFWGWGLRPEQEAAIVKQVGRAIPVLAASDWVDAEAYLMGAQWVDRDLALTEKLPAMIKRISNRPTYCRIMPRYTTTNDPIPADVLERYLRAAYASADGVVIWGANDAELREKIVPVLRKIHAEETAQPRPRSPADPR